MTEQSTVDVPEQVDGSELNSWRRGFTPQAEIWNGRLAMLGLSLGVVALVLWRLLATA
ncbi:high light inducible protein [Synechococcus sp. MIT S9452]|uniref:high light inducible protein n=1 Tax=Synechococcus sp. MIT S9452 TaxID=3082546 RepID=UPI0039A54EBD